MHTNKRKIIKIESRFIASSFFPFYTFAIKNFVQFNFCYLHHRMDGYSLKAKWFLFQQNDCPIWCSTMWFASNRLDESVLFFFCVCSVPNFIINFIRIFLLWKNPIDFFFRMSFILVLTRNEFHLINSLLKYYFPSHMNNGTTHDTEKSKKN